jgi:hypothetical protein
MGLFSRRPRTILEPEIPASLTAYGQAIIDGRRAGRGITDPRFGWENFILPVRRALLCDDRDGAIGELCDAASMADDARLARVGAYGLLDEASVELDDERFLALRDDALDYFRAQRFSSGHLTRIEADRWIEVHGDLRSSFDGIVDVDPPAPGEVPEPQSLDEPGGARMIALTAPLPDGNAFFAERRDDGMFVVFSERQRSDVDQTRARYEEDDVGAFPTLTGLLAAVGQTFGTPPHWANDDLLPYFPSRRA